MNQRERQVFWAEQRAWNTKQRKYMDEHDGKGPITVAFETWQDQASREEIQVFCDYSNGVAAMQRLVYKTDQENEI